MAQRQPSRSAPRVVTLANVIPSGPPRVTSLATPSQGARTVTLSMLSSQLQSQPLQHHPIQNQSHPVQNQSHPVQNPQPGPTPQEVESLRSLVSQQQAQIDVLTRSLEQLVINYRELKNDSEASRRRDTQTQTRLVAVETGQTEMRRTLETVEYRANIGFQNSTAEDDARQYMLDEREMVGDDTILTDGEIQRAATRINDRRPNRRR